jgi:hypothetical protein
VTPASAGPARSLAVWILLIVERDRPPTRTPPATATPNQRKQTTTDFSLVTENQQRRNNQPSKGERTTQKKLKILLVISLSKSTLCNSLQTPVEARRRIKTGGVFPCFWKRLQSRSENFSVLGNHAAALPSSAAPVPCSTCGVQAPSVPPWVEKRDPELMAVTSFNLQNLRGQSLLFR